MSDLKQTYHEQDDKVIVRSSQDIEPHMDYCANVRREERERIGRFGKTGDFHQKMSVPFNVISMVALRLGIPLGQVFDPEHSKRIFAELRRPEFAVFRTTERRI
jgi:hypothetical protein